jgi:hypothetical protein
MIWVVIAIELTEDGVNAWAYREFAEVKCFKTREAAEKYVASQNSELEYIVREEIIREEVN